MFFLFINIYFLFYEYLKENVRKLSEKKLKRKIISLETKIEILNCLRNGEGKNHFMDFLSK